VRGENQEESKSALVPGQTALYKLEGHIRNFVSDRPSAVGLEVAMKRGNTNSALGWCLMLSLILELTVFGQTVCAQTNEKTPKPEFYGVYAVQGNNLLGLTVSWSTHTAPKTPIRINMELPGHIDYMRNPDAVGLSPDVKFLFYLENPITTAQKSSLQRWFFKRNVTTWDTYQHPPRREKSESANYWAAYERIELLIKPVEGQPQMVLGVPSKPLEDGVYALDIESSLSFFSVGSVEAVRRTMCFDEDVAYSIVLRLGSKLTPCAETYAPTLGPGNPLLSPEPAALAMWDKALRSGEVSFVVYRERFGSSQEGSLHLTPTEVSFIDQKGQKVLAVRPSDISSSKVFSSTPVGISASWLQEHGLTLDPVPGVRLSIAGKNYNFEPFPLQAGCEIQASFVLCPEPGRQQQSVIANYVAQTIPKLASGGFAGTGQPPTPQGQAIPPSVRHISEQIRNEIASYEKTGGFRSPLDDEQFLELLVGQAQQVNVPPWLLFGQAKFETTFGNPINATTREGVPFTDGSTGNAHNLFNIRPGVGWKGKVLDTGRGGQFRVYSSYEESVRDYLRLMSGDPYKGKTLDQVINTYFPASENGPARVQSYIDSVIQFATKLGFTADKGTVPVP
jgi:hypothetical protein